MLQPNVALEMPGYDTRVVSAPRSSILLSRSRCSMSIRYRSIGRSAASPELNLRFGKSGLEGTSTLATHAYEAVSETIHPGNASRIEWPRADPNAAPINTTVIPSGRC